MYRFILLVLAALCIMSVWGCGGGGSSSGGGGTDTLLVNINSDRFTPKTVTVKTGDSVRWQNVDTLPHQVTSGTVTSTTMPVVVGPVSIGTNNIFIPSNLAVNLGDTINFRNDRMGTFVMDIIDDSNTVISTLTFNAGQIIGFSGFPTAGVYTFQQRNNPFFSGTVVVSGTPSPNGNFQSRVLLRGETFTTTFPTPGTFPYFDLDPQNPNRAILTGTVIVQ